MSNIFKSISLAIASLFASGASAQNQEPMNTGIYDIKINSLTGEELDLNQFKGKKILFVNVASKCGFTGQYAGLQELHEKYADKLVVIGLPCNQFGGQEPGSPEEIQTFCQKNYGVDFLITEKLDVKGENQHSVYQWLTQAMNNGVEDTKVKWNFNKYLIDEEGNYLAKFGSQTKPMSDNVISKL